jgi:chorismate mutase
LIDMARHRFKITLCAALAACAAFGAPSARADDLKHLLRPLVESSAQRLAIGDQVALSKWDSGKSVEDSARESAVISNAVAEGQQANLAAADVTRFFKAQIEANKLIQYELLARWRRAGSAPPHAPVDLTGTIRPELDRLQTTLIAELAAAEPVLDSNECAKEVARAVGHYALEHQFDPADLPVLALDRAMAGFCRIY